MKSPFKKITVNQIATALVLVSFLAVVFFSFAFMMYGPNGQMIDDCLLGAMGQSICPQGAVTTIIHHISAYHTFLNVFVGIGFSSLIISLLLAICAAPVIFSRLLSLRTAFLARVLYNLQPVNLYRRKITHWLSLFENSPSIA